MSGASNFDPLSSICEGDRADFVQRHVKSFEAHFARRNEESCQRFRTANQRVRSTASDVGLFSKASSGRPAQGGSSSKGAVSFKTSSKRPVV